MTRTTSGISVLLLMVAVINGLWWNIDIISFTDVCHSGPVAYDLRVTHISRRLFGVSGTITLAADFLEYLADAQIMFAPRPGGRFALFPLNIPPRDMCVGLNDFYVRYGMKDLANCSDLPQVDGPGPEVCQLFPNVSVGRSLVVSIMLCFRLHRDTEDVHGGQLSVRSEANTTNVAGWHVQSRAAYFEWHTSGVRRSDSFSVILNDISTICCGASFGRDSCVLL